MQCGLVGENNFCICTCGLFFARYSIPQVADYPVGRIGAGWMFQKVTQKVWFVVLVGLLLGLACGAVMARWPALRGVAACVAVVGALLLGRVGGAGGWLSLPVAAGVSAIGASLFVSRRWGFPVALVVAVASLVVGGIWGLWEAVRRRGARPDRNASVHPNGIPKYQSPPTDKNARIERLAVLLHNAGRSAVEPSGAFVEWDDAPERTRAGRRSQAQYLLAAGVVLPVNAAPPAGVKPSRVGEIVFRNGRPLGIMCEDGEVRPGIVVSKGKGELFFSRDDLRAKSDNSARPAEPTSGLTVTVSANETAADVAKRLPEYFRVTVDCDLEIIHQIPTTNVVIAPSAADREAAAK